MCLGMVNRFHRKISRRTERETPFDGENHMKLQQCALKRGWVAGLVFAMLGTSAAWGANVL